MVHIDIKCLPQMPDATSRRYLFVAIDRATRIAPLPQRSPKYITARYSCLTPNQGVAQPDISSILRNHQWLYPPDYLLVCYPLAGARNMEIIGWLRPGDRAACGEGAEA